MSPPVGKRINQHTRHALRLLDLHELLEDGEVRSIEELAALFGVATRTMNRDISELRDMGLRIEGSKGLGGGIRLRKKVA